MLELLCRNRVRDYESWRKIFDSHCNAQVDSGMKLTRLWRSADDPNTVFFIFEVSDRKKAEAFMADPAAAEAGRQSGVIDGEVYFVERDEP